MTSPEHILTVAAPPPTVLQFNSIEDELYAQMFRYADSAELWADNFASENNNVTISKNVLILRIKNFTDADCGLRTAPHNG